MSGFPSKDWAKPLWTSSPPEASPYSVKKSNFFLTSKKAPEVITDNFPKKPSNMLYGLGIIFYLLCYGKHPIQNYNMKAGTFEQLQKLIEPVFDYTESLPSEEASFFSMVDLCWFFLIFFSF